MNQTNYTKLGASSSSKNVVQELVHSRYDLDIPPASNLSSSLTSAIPLKFAFNAAALYSDGHIHNMLNDC